MTKILPRMALTPGEPAGIGPDLCVMIAQENLSVELVAIADKELLRRRANSLGISLELIDFKPVANKSIHSPGTLKVIDEKLTTFDEPGKLNKTNASYVLNTIDKAIDGCLNGQFDAMVTGPIHKGVINEALSYPNDKAIKNNIPAFTGHTEYIAARTGCNLPVMMLATNGLRVALVTTHLPLSSVSENITANRLTQVIEILHQEMINHFSINKPTILVSGLNPHAGEDGHLGNEEIEIIIPVLNNLRKRGMSLVGPLPADTLFVPNKLAQADVVLAMYHDQGLPVLKHKGFGKAINVTLGLPIIRTSVDHGVALELAGTGEIDTGSLKLAIETAAEMVLSTDRKIARL